MVEKISPLRVKLNVVLVIEKLFTAEFIAKKQFENFLQSISLKKHFEIFSENPKNFLLPKKKVVIWGLFSQQNLPLGFDVYFLKYRFCFVLLRFYWDPDIDNCLIRQVNAVMDYGYEYQGVASRLVITPLTDRIFTTITGACNIKVKLLYLYLEMRNSKGRSGYTFLLILQKTFAAFSRTES